MFLKSQSHHWVNKPFTSYEIRRELRIRESRHTAMLFDRKYLNIDTGKYQTDKLHTLHALSWTDIVSCDPEYFSSQDARHTVYSRKYKHRHDHDDDQKWFTPPDDDFDGEFREEPEPEQVTKLVEVKAQPVFVARPVFPATFVREDGSPMVCHVKKNCWKPK